MQYFTYLHPPYAPDESWYKSREYWDAATEATYEIEGRRYTWRFTYSHADRLWKAGELIPVDWNRVACDYQHLVIAMPFKESAIEVPTSIAAYNETVALLMVDKRARPPERHHKRTVRLPLER